MAGCSGTNNLEYISTGYLFRIRVNSIQAGQPLVLQVYDPAWMYTEDFCNNGNMPTDLQQNNIPALTGAPWNITNVVPAGPGNISRYGTSNGGQGINVGGTRWCTGDQNAGGGSGNIQNTTYIVRKPDLTPWDDTDNIVAECPARVLPGHQPADADAARPDQREQRRHLCEELLPPVGDRLHDPVRERDARRLRHPGEDQRQSRRSDGPRRRVPDLGRGCRSDFPHEQRRRLQPVRDAHGYGTSSGPNGNAPDGTGVSISATKNLPIYANAGSDTTPEFYLARITPTAGSGRTLSLNFYDIGDVGSGSVNVQIQAPSDSNYSGGFPVCTYHRDNTLTEVTASGCTIPTMTTAIYNGRLTTMTIPIPANYNCDFASNTGCWVKVGMTYTSGAAPNDTTTWSATLAGDPVRLVE